MVPSKISLLLSDVVRFDHLINHSFIKKIKMQHSFTYNYFNVLHNPILSLNPIVKSLGPLLNELIDYEFIITYHH